MANDGEEFLTLTKTENQNKTEKIQSESSAKANPKLVYGIRGIANLFDCSIATANRIKKSGVIDGAIFQRNRTIVVMQTKPSNYLMTVRKNKTQVIH